MDKKKLRQIYRTKRDNLSISQRREKSLSIKRVLFSDSDFRAGETILFFSSFGSEVETQGMIKEALMEERRVILPLTCQEERRLKLYEINSLDQLKEGVYGIMEPDSCSCRPVESKELEVIIIPGLIFDYRGYRIGYGGGYYDRLLENKDPAVPGIALAFEIQLREGIPVEDHDLPVDKLITEERVYSFTEGEKANGSL